MVAVAATSTPCAAVDDSAQAQTAAKAAEPLPTFDIWEFRVEGNFVLPTLAVEKAVYPHLGPARTIEDVEAARRALEQAYQGAGYLTVLVDIPEQQVEGGLVRLRVTEGKIGQVKISGNRFYSRGEIRRRTPELTPGSVPDFVQVQSELAAVSRSPDMRVTPVLRPSKTPGEVDVELKVEDKLPLHGDIELNNRETPNTEPLRVQASLRYDNLWQRQHSVSLLYQTAPQELEQLQVVSGTYVLPLGSRGDALAFYGIYSNSDVAAIGATNVVGKGTVVGARWIVALPPREHYFHTATLGIDYKDFEDTVELGADQIATPVSYVPLSLGYRVNFAAAKSTNSGSLTLNFAPGVVLGAGDDQFQNKRFDASASYAYLRGDWLTELGLSEQLGLQLTLQGQATGQPLISNEQFCAGGFDSVRGYLECEVLGDDGLIGGLELRRFLVLGPKGGAIESFYVLAFVQGGAVWIVETLPGQESHYDLASVGIGVRARAYKYFDAALDLAVPLIGGPSTEQYDPRVLFSLAARF